MKCTYFKNLGSIVPKKNKFYRFEVKYISKKVYASGNFKFNLYDYYFTNSKLKANLKTLLLKLANYQVEKRQLF